MNTVVRVDDGGHKTFTAFVLIPKDRTRQEFLVVRDQKPDHVTLRKFPGGSGEGAETPEEAAEKEALEETYQRIARPRPAQRLLEVHIRSRDNPSQSHHDIFFMSDPPVVEREIVRGPGIAEASWMTRGELLDRIQKREFNHKAAAAFLWMLRRDAYEASGDVAMLAPIFELQSNLFAWTVKEGGVLALCFYPFCSECDHKKFDRILRNRRQAVPKTSEEKIPEPPVEEAPIVLDGEYKYLILHRGRFEDFAFLEPSGIRWGYQIPFCRFSVAMIEQAAEILSVHLGIALLKFVSILEQNNPAVVIFRADTKEALRGLEAFNLNRPPDDIDFHEWRIVAQGVERLNSHSQGKERITLNYGWDRKAFATSHRGPDTDD